MESYLEALRALDRGDLGTLSQLLEADPHLAGARDAGGTSLVLQALYRHLPEALELLLARAPELDLASAAALGHEERLGQLLAAGAPPAQPCADGFLPLHLACYFGREGAVRVLLAAGADPAAPAVAHPSGVAPLASAVAGGHLEVAALLLERGAPPSPRQAGGFTPLHAAAGRGRRELCELLLAAGADPAERDDAGADAADHAERSGHRDLAQALRIAIRGAGC